MVAERDPHGRTRNDAAGKEDPAVLARGVGRVPADESLDLDHPAHKVEITVNGDRGTLHFECHYIDAETETAALVTAADMDVARIDEEWLVTNMVAGSTELDLSPCRRLGL